MATSEDQEGRLVAFHFTSWLTESLETELADRMLPSSSPALSSCVT